jgi:hypothetical protein
MRPSLVEGLLVALRRNVGQGRPGTALVELGRVFRPVDDPLAGVLDAFGDDWRWRAPDGAELPVQPRVLGLAAQGLVTGERWLDTDVHWGVEDLLAVFDEVVARLRPDRDGRALEREPAERGRVPPRSHRAPAARRQRDRTGRPCIPTRRRVATCPSRSWSASCCSSRCSRRFRTEVTRRCALDGWSATPP